MSSNRQANLPEKRFCLSYGLSEAKDPDIEVCTVLQGAQNGKRTPPASNRDSSLHHAASEGQERGERGSSSVDDEWHFYALKEGDIVSLFLWLVSQTFHVLYVTLPDYFILHIPNFGSVISLVALYVFTQALALLWGFVAVAVSVMCTRFVLWLDKCEVFVMNRYSTSPVCMFHGPWGSLHGISRVYMNFAVLQLCWFIGNSLFEVGWEMYGDFPRVRILLDPRQYTDLSPSSTDSRHGKEPHKAYRVVGVVQRIFLIAPIVVLFFLSLLLSFIPLLCGDDAQLSDEQDWPWVLHLLANNKSRLNRTLRFTIFVGLVQWAQQFHCLFPRWHSSLNRSSSAVLVKCLLVVMAPISGFRLLEWTVRPSKTSVFSTEIWSLPCDMLDNFLVTVWSMLFLLASWIILHLPPRELSAAGWQKDVFTRPDLWFRQTLRFKFICVVFPALHFFRGLLSETMGFTFAQNDLLLIVIEYPLLLVVIWSVGYCCVLLKFSDLQLLPPICVGAWFICYHVAKVRAPGVIVAVSLHLGLCALQAISAGSNIEKCIRRGSFVAKTMSRAVAYSRLARGFGGMRGRVLGAGMSEGELRKIFSDWPLASGAERIRLLAKLRGRRNTFGESRDIAATIGRIFLATVCAFGCTMLCFGTLSLIQSKSGWYPKASFISASRHPERNLTTISHAISRLDLYTHPVELLEEERGDADHRGSRRSIRSSQYAICQATLWGLRPVDYSLLSLSAYFDPQKVGEVLQILFPPESGMQPPVVVSSHSRSLDVPLDDRDIFWTEFAFLDKNVTVIALRGTEFWRISDWYEDIRMWTEPVVLSMLSVVFPTIRSWSPHATSMVLDTLHALLDSVGLPDPEYKYNRVVEYIRKVVYPDLPQSHQLVLTGHSLGGGIAHIAAALLNEPVVSFTPPGAYQSLSKHLYWNAKDRRQLHQAAHNRTVTILAENDMIGRIFDSHGGLVQTITCDTDQLGPVGCHMLENTICNLIQKCGKDHRWASCHFSYEATPLYEGIFGFLQDSYEQGGTIILAMLTSVLACLSLAIASIGWVWVNL
uniref:Fungal lipase-type domain-containing protein n=1 Tax=Guillardia theta TaxID=55529 RepID=A0A7S4NLK8_GUITH|mmetsp:Transcript_25422/g.84083  ORF Transcript_25422/g.84083 Transcript_25422/m.84083 type:complete len:1047 (+) Transcript_25422:123-3263(+)